MKLIHYFTVVVTVLLVIYLVWDYLSGSSQANLLSLWIPKSGTGKVDYSLANNEKMNEVPSTTTLAREGFTITEGDAVDLAVKKLLTVTDTADKSTIASSLSGICGSARPNLFTGFRSLQSGATFKLEEVKNNGESKNPKEYVLHAINGKVVQVDKTTNTLSLAVKDTSKDAQKFKEQAISASGVLGVSNIGSGAVYLESVAQPGYALQYEHEQLSLRPLNKTDPKVFLGQAFVTFPTTDAELEATALSLGVPLGLDGEELQPGIRAIIPSYYSPPTTTTVAGAGAGTSTPGTLSLADLTNAQIKSVLDSIVPDIKSYIAKTGGEAPKSNSFGQKEGELTINVNLDDATSESFQDLTGETNQSQNSVRALLTAYTKKQQELELGGIPAVGERLSSVTPTLGDALLGKIKSCPAFDRSKYLTERQIAQCSGCSPDPYLRGQL
jgi:hypothetical protein